METGANLSHINFTPAVAGAPLPESSIAMLQNAADYFAADERSAPFAPPWLKYMVSALSQQGRNRILTVEAAAQFNLKFDELRACYELYCISE